SYKHSGLTIGIAAADHHDFFAFTKLSFDVGRTVIDPASLKTVAVIDTWLVITNASCNHNRPCEQDTPILHYELIGTPMALQLNNCASNRHLRTELLGLRGRVRR